MLIKIEFSDGESLTLDEEISAAILAAARHRHRTPAQIIKLALRQKIRLLRTPSAVAGIMAAMREKDAIQKRRADLAKTLDVPEVEAGDRAVKFLSTYLRVAGK